VKHHSFAHEFILHYPTHSSSKQPDSTIISALPEGYYPTGRQEELEDTELDGDSEDTDTEFGPFTYPDKDGNFAEEFEPGESISRLLQSSRDKLAAETSTASGQDPPVEDKPVESTSASAFEWPDINPEDKWIYQKVFHPFSKPECPVALPSSPHPSQIMAAYYDPAFDTIETVADFDNNFSDALRVPRKISLDTRRYLFSASVISMLSFGEFFPTH
jgi:hypothetical protein